MRYESPTESMETRSISKEPEELLNPRHDPLRLKMKTVLVQQQKYPYFITSDKIKKNCFGKFFMKD